jgi:hypothetical protein
MKSPSQERAICYEVAWILHGTQLTLGLLSRYIRAPSGGLTSADCGIRCFRMVR